MSYFLRGLPAIFALTLLWFATTSADRVQAKNPSGSSLHTAEDQDSKEKGLELYSNKIKSILVDNCYECHSTKEETYEGGLDVQFRRTLLDGGDRGAAIEPGDPDDSLLMAAIGYEEEDLEMPPDGKLDEDEIKSIAEWIRLGAPMPDEN